MAGKIGEILLKLGYISEADMQEALKIQNAEGGRRKLGEILTDEFLTEDILLRALSMQADGKLDPSLDIVSHILRHRLEQTDIKSMLDSLSHEGHDFFLEKVSDILNKVGSFLDISKRLSDVLSLDTLLENMIGMVTEALSADRATLFLNDKDTFELFSRIIKGGKISEIRFPNHLGIAGSVYTTGKTINIPDAYQDARFNPEIDKRTGYRTRNILCSPIKLHTGEIIGVVQVLNKKDGDFTPDDITILEVLTSQAAAALQNAQLVDQLKKAAEEESQLLEITTAISTELNLQPLLQKIMDTTTEMLDADRSTLFMYDQKTSELWSLLAQGADIKEIRFASHLGIAGSVFTTGNTVNIPDAYEDSRFNPEVDKKTGYKTKSILCMPVINKKGRTIGVMQVLNKKGGPFTGVDEKRLRAFTSQTSIAIENATLFDEVLTMKNYNESMLESMSNGIITIDQDNIIVKCNQASERILQTDADELVEMDATAYFRGSNAWVAERLQRVQKTCRVELAMDTELFLEDGTPVSVNLTVVPLMDAKNEPMGTMLVFEDITQEKRLKSTMARYMSQELAEKLLESGEEMLGGQALEGTVFFSDIRGFTTISEDLGATGTVAMLNEYFTEMVDIIFKHHGILDKYIGDAIMAVFGIPFPKEGDADNAVKAAIEMMQKLVIFNRHRAAEGKHVIDIGIGLNTDTVVSGNIGSLKRMDYTVIGDGVNLASRLESANKFYSSKILISEFTHNKLKQPCLCREVDIICVKGKLQPVNIYEVLDFHDQHSFPNLHETLELYAQGLKRYREHAWQEGRTLFEQALELNPRDGLSKIYYQRCCHFEEDPPAEDWDGVWVMKSK